MHYVIGMVIPELDEDIIEEWMEPYDENRRVAPYGVHCECDKYGPASDYGYKMADRLVGSIEWFRSFNSIPGGRDSELYQIAWQQRQETKDQYAQMHPLYQKPDPECEECHGSGTRITTYNPNSQWDWYVIGGRWSDIFETIEIKDWQEAYDNRELTDASLPVSVYIEKLQANPEFWWKWAGFIVPPKGQWIDRSGYKAPDSFTREELIEFLAPFADHFIVVIDIHI